MALPLILIVDPETASVAKLTAALTREGYRVLSTGSIAGLRALEVAAVDILMVASTLPDGHGLSLIHEFRRGRDCGIIMLTGKQDKTDQVLGLEIGADDCISRPFRMREVLARVNALYRRLARNGIGTVRGSAGDVGVLIDESFDGYKLSSVARQVWGPDGAEILLTTAEFDLLLTLLRRKGAVLSRDVIMARIKGRDWASSDRSVDGLVSRLRRKLPPVPPRVSPYIRTVHGAGYAFSA